MIILSSSSVHIERNCCHGDVCINICICVYICISILLYVYMCICIYMCNCIYIYIFTYMYVESHAYSTGLGPGRVRSPTCCFHCNICYVCKATFTFIRLCCNICCVCLAFLTNVAIVVVHCLDNCCLLLKKWARQGGPSGSPWLEPFLGITPQFTF